MKRLSPIFSSLLVAMVAMPGFSSHAAHMSSAPVVETSKQHMQLSDEQIMGIIMAVDESEIAAANIAETKKIMAKVYNYADYLKKQHMQNLAAMKKLERETGLMPIQSAQSIGVLKDAHKEALVLKALNGRAFETAYMKAMVKGHAGGLKLINTVFLKDVKNVKLKKFIESFRALVTRHLEKGKKIQAGLK